ncbi:MAG: VOC family protein [Bacteroidota bacterium]
MKATEIVLELMVKDVQETIQFYSEILEFELEAKEEDNGKLYWAKLSNHGFSISLKEEGRLKSEEEFMKEYKVGGSFSLCFQVDDLEHQYERVKVKCELFNHPHLTPCGATQFSMKDNNGYVINFERFN